MSALLSEQRRVAALSAKHRYYVASLILHASKAEITAQLFSLSYLYLILSIIDYRWLDYQDFCAD